MTPEEFTAIIQAKSPEEREEYVRRFNNLTPEEIAKARESLAHKAVKIEETLTIEIGDFETAYDWETDDYRIQQIRVGLTGFVRMVADKHAKSPAEAELIVMAVAKALFDSFYADAVSEILRERLMRKDGER